MSELNLSDLSADSLRRAADISEKIEALRAELAGILAGGSAPAAAAPAAAPAKKKRKYTRKATTSAAPATPAAKPAKKKRKRKPLSPEALANIRAAQAKRWAKVRAGKQ